jgi:hypothetical protein
MKMTQFKALCAVEIELMAAHAAVHRAMSAMEKASVDDPAVSALLAPLTAAMGRLWDKRHDLPRP